MMHFIFPASPISPKEPDEIYRDQALALRQLGFGISLLPFEGFQQGSSRVIGTIPTGATVVYRGWMMSAVEYERFVALVSSLGAKALTPLDSYLACHHLPNWYPLVSSLTAETKVFSKKADIADELAALDWGKFFLKDFVKSLKTSVGSVISKPEEARIALVEMEKYRGTIEGGICVRRFEVYREGSEIRFFVIRGIPHAPAGDVPEVVRGIVERIPSQFFSVDLAVRDDGVQRIVEIGDGQVSDIVGWDVGAFANLWKEMSNID